MNRSSSIKTNSIAQNCRSILREHCRCIQRTCNHTAESGIFPQQRCPPNTWRPCHAIPTNPICSPYGVDNLRAPIVCCEEPSYYNTLSGLSPTIPSSSFARHPNCIDRNTAPMQSVLNRQTSHVQYLSTPSENCIQMITNAIITKIRYKIPQEETALLCCCLPSLIQQIMCKNPRLTPNDIIQCLSADIIKEAMDCFNLVGLNGKNDFHKSKQDHNNREKLEQPRKDNKFDDTLSIKSHDDDNDSLLSHRSRTSTNSQESLLSQRSSRSVLDLPNNIQKKTKHRENQREMNDNDRSPSTRSFSSQQSNDHGSSSHHSATPSASNTENKSKQSEENTPVHIEEEEEEGDERSLSSPDKDSYWSTNTFDANEDFGQKSIDLSPTPELDNQSTHIQIEYPGKKDPNAIRDVEKCLAFYQKMREYFDDDVAAMLLKCCLCYGDCSGKR